MNTNRALSILILAVLTTAFVGAVEVPLAPEKPQDTELQLVGDLISIRESIYQFPSLTLAYSDKSNVYLVVYAHALDDYNKDIFGQFVDAATGKLIGQEFQIASSDVWEDSPDVEYDPYKDVFLVVYDSETCTTEPDECVPDIKGRVVEEPVNNDSSLAESPLAPNEFTVAVPQSTGFSIYEPKIAYNRDDHQYLVVYRSGFGGYADTTDLRGQMLRSHKETPVRLGPEKGFHISGTAGYYYLPDVAWASKSSTFLVIAEMTDEKSPEFATYQQLAADWLHDTYQGTSSQVISGWGKICPRPPLTKFCTNPAVAYDPLNDSYTIVFNYDKKGENWDEMTIYGQRLSGEFKTNEEFFLGDPFPIETNLNKHDEYFSPEISYSGLDSTMHVPYHAKVNFTGSENDYHVLYLRALNGSQVSSPLKVRDSSKESYLSSTPLASSLNGQSLVIWGEDFSVEWWDLFGQRVGTYYFANYLPSIFKQK